MPLCFGRVMKGGKMREESTNLDKKIAEVFKFSKHDGGLACHDVDGNIGVARKATKALPVSNVG